MATIILITKGSLSVGDKKPFKSKTRSYLTEVMKKYEVKEGWKIWIPANAFTESVDNVW
jgi:hypothetical protein